MKKPKHSRTLYFAAALAVLGAVEASAGFLEPALSPEVFGVFCFAIAVIVAALRFVTTQALFINDKESEE